MTAGIYIKTPFAISGDQTAIPDGFPAPVGGEVCFELGFPIKYSQDPNTTGLRIDRAQSNYMYYILTLNQRQYQTEGAPRFITSAENGGSPFSYDKYATVLYDAGTGLALYQSLINSNTGLPTDTSKWRKLDPYNQAIERASPAFTGTPTAPTVAPATDSSTKLATTAFVQSAVAAYAVPAATTSVAGIARLAVFGDTSSTDKIVTPAILAASLAAGVLPASETQQGIAELATQAETNAGTDDARIVTPLKLKTSLPSILPAATTSTAGVLPIATVPETLALTSNTKAVTPFDLGGLTSSETQRGIIEIATQGETDTGTDDVRAITPLKYETNIAPRLALKAPLASPALSGVPTAPTAAGGTNTTQIATTAFVTAALPKKQTLTAQTLTTGISSTQTMIFAHTLGVIPDLIYADMVCLTAEGGYSIGDRFRISIPWLSLGGSSGGNRQCGCVPSSSNIVLSVNAMANFFNKSNTALFTATSGRWNIEPTVIIIS